MEFKIYCEECEAIFYSVKELNRMNYIGADFDLLCCPYCDNDSDLRLIIDKINE